jgi:hypothetical protein
MVLIESPFAAHASAQLFRMLIATTEWSLGSSLTRSRTSPRTVARTWRVVDEAKLNQEVLAGGALREEDAREEPLPRGEIGRRLVSAGAGVGTELEPAAAASYDGGASMGVLSVSSTLSLTIMAAVVDESVSPLWQSLTSSGCAKKMASGCAVISNLSLTAYTPSTIGSTMYATPTVSKDYNAHPLEKIICCQGILVTQI